MSIFFKKYCSYKNCKSNNSDPLCTETFFAFPKNREKYKLWVMLSRCDNVNLDKNQTKSKYLCSKHFDHKKYISWNPRRKLLLSNAIPYKYESDNDDDESDNDSDDYDDDDDVGDDDDSNCVNDDNHNIENLDNNNNSEDEYEELEILHVLENSDDIDETQTQEELNYIKISDNDNVEYLENELSNSPKNNYTSSPVIVSEQKMIKIENQQSQQQLNNNDDQRYYQQINDNKRRKLNEIKFSPEKKVKLVSKNDDDDDNQQISTTTNEEREDILCVESVEEEQEEDYSNKNNDNNDFRIRIKKSQNYLNTNENYVHKVTNNDGHDDNNDDDDVNNLITNPFIITFIHKNEEYIKMPKSIYCKEKRKLLNEIKYYKDVIINFKKQLMNVRM